MEPPWTTSSTATGGGFADLVGDLDVRPGEQRGEDDHDHAQPDEQDRGVRHLVAAALDRTEHALTIIPSRARPARRGPEPCSLIACRLVPAAAKALGEAAEELGLGEHRLLELVEQHALVRARGCSRSRPSFRRAGSRRREPPRWSALTSGIEPPVATHDGSLPQALCRAARAARYAGPDVVAEKPFPISAASTSSGIPNGRIASRCRTSAACASLGSCAGWMRRLILARAVRDDRVDGVVDRQDVDSRHRERRPGPEARSRGRPSRRRERPARSPRARGTPRRCTRPRSIPRDGGPARRRRRSRRAASASAWRSAIRASGAAPPNWPLCFGPASVLTWTVTTAIPRRPDGERRDAGPEAAHVPDHHRVGREQLGLRGRERGEGAPDLLLALDHDLDPDGRVSVPRSQRADVHQDVRLRVGGAAAVDRAVAFGRLERRRFPLRLVAHRHDVVVPVEQDGRSARRPGNLADHHRSGVGELEHVDLLHAGIAEQPQDSVARLEQRRSRVLREAEGGDRRDRDEPGELRPELRHQRGDLRGECGGVDL